jgi:7-cyano-7-deazaguanine synthase in queuosine biosynthesis
VSTNPNESRILVSLESGKDIELWLKANVDLDNKLDCWLFLMLPVCMKLGEDLEVTGTISQTAVSAFHKAQEELLIAHPHLKKISLLFEGDLQEDIVKPDRTVGSFFSGGLDSTYTAETIRDIQTLVGIWGFDISLKREDHWKLSKDLLEKYSQATGKELILVKTNIRELSNGLLSWGADYHGTALSGVAKALSNHLKKAYISATHTEETKRWGQFPSLSRAFSTDTQELEEHGAVVRTEKAFALADKPETTLLRVCYRNKTDLANCGVCQKCIRTRIEFSLVKAKYRPIGLEKKPTFIELLKVKILGNDFLFFKDSIGWARRAGFPNTYQPLIAINLARLISRVYYRLNPEKKTKD